MPFRDVRDLSEHLKLLGYPNPFPLQALSKNCGCLASFYVVAEVLQWLANLMEPGITLAGSVHTKEDRVQLIRSATEFFITKSAVKLNPRKLYAACFVTAIELQKITKLLITPPEGFNNNGSDDEELNRINQIDIGDKMGDLRKARDLSVELLRKMKTLSNLLLREGENKEARLNQASRPLELAAVERHLKNAVAAAQVKLKSDRVQLENARIELNALKSKLNRKRGDLERTKQRLEALQKIRPAHMQEFEECEKELKSLFQQYFRRLHVRDALKAQFEARTKKAALVSTPMLVQKPNENSISFLNDGLLMDQDNEMIDDINNHVDNDNDNDNDVDVIVDDNDDEMLERDGKGMKEIVKRPSTATRRARPSALDRIMNGSTTATIRRHQVATEMKNKAYVVDGDGTGMDALNDGMNEDSSFGSMDSDLNMSELLASDSAAISVNGPNLVGSGLSLCKAPAKTVDRRDESNHNHRINRTVRNVKHSMPIHNNDHHNHDDHDGNDDEDDNDNDNDDDDDDDFDLNSMESISISKLTGELPLRPKTAAKQKHHHSDEDF